MHIKWVKGAKVDLLGFTFHYINTPWSSRVTEQRSNSVQNIRGGLYVYPSKESTTRFKKKIKSMLSDNLNWSPYRIICALNPIIRGWGNYFGVGTLREFSRLDHYVYYRTYRYIRRKFKKVSVDILTERYYRGISTPSGRSWQFHGTWNGAPNDRKVRKGDIEWLVLLCKLSKPVPSQMFRANLEVLRISFYIDSKPFEKWSTNMFKLRSLGKTFNNWSVLYKQQKGICVECGESLGYLLEENLEIHHINQVSKWDSSQESVNKLSNLQLIHKSCHRAILVAK
jgi:RNA-directed DNA polymerase